MKMPHTHTHLPDAAEISQVEDVVKLGWSWKHLGLRSLPQFASRRHQHVHHSKHFRTEVTFLQTPVIIHHSKLSDATTHDENAASGLASVLGRDGQKTA